jgi:hypothetical protein
MNDKKTTPTVPVIEAIKTKEKDVVLDKAGFFVIELVNNSIQVEFYHNVMKDQRIVSGKLNKIFTGTTAAALCDTIARYIPNLRPDHYLYLGRELMCAELALDQHKKYEQGGC